MIVGVEDYDNGVKMVGAIKDVKTRNLKQYSTAFLIHVAVMVRISS